MEKTNRINAALADSDKTSQWLIDELVKGPATVSKWRSITV